MLWRELGGVERQIERVNRHLSFRVDQSDFDIALLIREAGSYPVQQPWTVLCNHLHQCAGRRACMIKINPGFNFHFGDGAFFGALPIAQHAGEVRFEKGAITKVKVETDRKSTRLNSSHQIISYAVFCLKKKTTP